MIFADVPPVLSMISDVLESISRSALVAAVNDIFPTIARIFATVMPIFSPIKMILNAITAWSVVWTNSGSTGRAGRIFPVRSRSTTRSGRVVVSIASLCPIRMVLLEAFVGLRVVLLEALQSGLALLLSMRHDFLVLRWIRRLQFLQSFLDMLPPLLKRLTKGFGILLLQSLQAFLPALPKLIGDPLVGRRVGFFQIRQALLELGLALLDGLLKRFGVVLFELPQPLHFLGDLLAPSRLAVVRILRHRFLRCLFFLCQNPARGHTPHRKHKTQQKSLHGSALLCYPIRRPPSEKVYTRN